MADPSLPATPRDPRHRPDPRARWVWATSEALVGVVVTGAAAAVNGFWWQSRWGWWIVGAIGVISLLGVVVVPWLRWRVHRWEVLSEAVVTRVGWWSVEHRVAPMSRVQTVDLRRGPLEQLFGLATVTVTTASHAGPVVLPCIDHTQAQDLVEQLTAAAGVHDAT